MLEVEMKFPVADLAPIERRLADWGAVADHPRTDVDHYFNAPDRDFARTDEAFRLRRIGTANYITYKGPKRDAQTKTRTEIEVPLGDGDNVAEDFTRLAICLGYRPVAEVCKQRRVFHLKRGGFGLEFCLDQVTDVGSFVEIEILADEHALVKARGVVMQTAAELGLDTSERRSYLELLLTRREQ